MDSEEKVDDLEYILEDIGGTFGRFQIFNYALFAVPLLLSNGYTFDYVFTTLDLDYRCQIPECEIVSSTDFNPYWLENAVPFEDSKPVRCMRYSPILNSKVYPELNSCEAYAFNRSAVVECLDGEFIFRTDEISIVNEFNITCEDMNWRLPFIGAANNVAKFIFLPIFGLVSDRFGRVPVLVTSAFIGSAFKLLSSFATSYEMFMVLSFLDNGAGSGLGSAFILGLEWASTEKRILVSTIMFSSYPLGQLLTGFVAAQTHNYKWMLRIMSLPGLLLIIYVWLAPESLRWLLVKKKYDRAIATVKHASKMNRIEPSQRTFDIISAKYRSDDDIKTTSSNVATFSMIFTSTQLLIRLAICILGCIGCIFVVYGVNISSVLLSGDKYWNFSIVALASAPAIFLSYFSLTYMGRRWSVCSSMILSGVTIIASYYTSHYPTASLVLFFAGNLFIRHSSMVLSVYVGESWPTSVRHTISNICLMFGRTGSILAPMTLLLAQYAESLSFFLIFGVAVVSGLLFLFLPETFDTKLPDTIEETKSLGKKREQVHQINYNSK